MIINAICNTCARQHAIDFDPIAGPGAAFSDWLVKHPQHDIDFVYPQRSRRDKEVSNNWMAYLHNADVKTAYGATEAMTITLASLATQSTLLTVQSSTARDNGVADKYLDFLCAGKIRTGTSPTAGSIIVGFVGNHGDTPTWPIVDGSTKFDGTNTSVVIQVQSQFDQNCRVAAFITTDATARSYPWGPISLAGLYGGLVPDQFQSFVVHNTVQALSSTAGDHSILLTPVYQTV